jgi:hypothetical protein
MGQQQHHDRPVRGSTSRSIPQYLAGLICLCLLAACGAPAVTSKTTNPEVSTPGDATIPPEIKTPMINSLLVCRDESCLVDGVQLDYLIVTRPKFAEALTPFINWKTESGFNVGLVTVEWLEANYPGRHLAERMKTGMHDLRKRVGVKYVLLVGDTAMEAWNFNVQNVLSSYTLSEDFNVPTGYYRRVNSDPPEEVLPSDAYYVEDQDWDPENSGLNPRPDNMESGEGTLHADLYLGRWPVREIDEISVLLDKTMQATTATQIFFSADQTLSDGVTIQCPSWPPGEYGGFACYLDSMITARTRFFESNAPHITTESMFVNLKDSQQASAFLDKFLENRGVLVAAYHGNVECWGIQQECIPAGDIHFTHIFPLLEAEACLISTFYFEGTSVSEILVLSPTGPAVLTQAPNPVLFMRDLRDGKSVGEAFWATASVYVYWPNPIILLGDPSLVIFRGP